MLAGTDVVGPVVASGTVDSASSAADCVRDEISVASIGVGMVGFAFRDGTGGKPSLLVGNAVGDSDTEAGVVVAILSLTGGNGKLAYGLVMSVVAIVGAFGGLMVT